MIYCQLDPKEQTSVIFFSKYKTFLSRKCNWKYRLRNGSHFVHPSMCQYIIDRHTNQCEVMCLHNYFSNGAHLKMGLINKICTVHFQHWWCLLLAVRCQRIGPSCSPSRPSERRFRGQETVGIHIQWRHNERNDISNHRRRLFTQPFFQVQIKKPIKVPRHWTLWGEFPGDRWIPHTKDQ